MRKSGPEDMQWTIDMELNLLESCMGQFKSLSMNQHTFMFQLCKLEENANLQVGKPISLASFIPIGVTPTHAGLSKYLEQFQQQMCSPFANNLV